jgi:hypothetical protein
MGRSTELFYVFPSTCCLAIQQIRLTDKLPVPTSQCGKIYNSIATTCSRAHVACVPERHKCVNDNEDILEI